LALDKRERNVADVGLFACRVPAEKRARDIADNGLDVATLATELIRADCCKVALAAIEVRVFPTDEDTVGRATLLVTPRLVFRCKPYAVKVLAAAGRMLNRASPLLICTLD
jgi:hypothetical protein